MWPHEIKLTAQPNGGNNIAAQIKRVNSAGPFVRLDLARQSDGEVFTVELTKTESRDSPLQADAQVYVELKNIRVFREDYAIWAEVYD